MCNGNRPTLHITQSTLHRSAVLLSGRGVTLAEVLVTSVVATIALTVIMTTNQGRLTIENDLRARRGADFEAALGVLQLITELERVDRVKIVDFSTLQIRRPEMTTAGCAGGVIPQPSCFDDAANYRWMEYAHVDADGDGVRDALRVYENTAAGCGTNRILSTQIGLVGFDFSDASNIPPPGGEPFPSGQFAGKDNNVVDYQIRWDGPVTGVVLSPTSRLFGGHVAIRAGVYNNLNVNAASGDSGSGLAPGGVSNPPAVCRP